MARFRCAFTLIELLVVIAIIALLIGILLPSLAAARATSKALMSTNNLRSLSLGMQMYADQQDAYPPHRMASGTHEPTGRTRARWHWLLSEFVGGPPYQPRNAEERRSFETTNDIPRIDNKVFIDPAHRLEDFRSKQTGEIQALRNGSYGFNYQFLGNARSGTGPNGLVNHPVRPSSVFVPAGTVGLATSSGSQSLRIGEGFREHAYTLDPPRLEPDRTRSTEWGHSSGPVPAGNYHRGKAIVGWLDGHASAEGLDELGYAVEDDSAGLVGVDAGSNRFFNGTGDDADARAEQPGRPLP
ncbi:MAG: DUF1559 family PulG-like putative transporter [Phycisphaerales bacterium]